MGDTKACPYCAETVDRGAVKCRHCGESLKGGYRGMVKPHWRGDQLIVCNNDAVQGSACLICGGDDQLQPRSRQFIYTPPWVYLGILGGILPLIILALIARKTATISLPLCKGCNTRWTLAEVGLAAFAVVGLFLIPGVFAFITQAALGKDSVWIGLLVGFLAWLGGVIALKLWVSRRLQVRCVIVENDRATLAVPDLELARASIREPEA